MSRAGMYGTTEAYIFDYAFLGAYNVAIFEDVLGKVNVGRSSAVFYLLDSLFDVGLCDWHCRGRCHEGRCVCGGGGVQMMGHLAKWQDNNKTLCGYSTGSIHHEAKYALRTWFAILNPSRDTT